MTEEDQNRLLENLTGAEMRELFEAAEEDEKKTDVVRKTAIEREFAAMLEAETQYTSEADRLIAEYAQVLGIAERKADVALHAAAEDLIDAKDEDEREDN
jgi:hypothetical protein